MRVLYKSQSYPGRGRETERALRKAACEPAVQERKLKGGAVKNDFTMDADHTTYITKLHEVGRAILAAAAAR